VLINPVNCLCHGSTVVNLATGQVHTEWINKLWKTQNKTAEGFVWFRAGSCVDILRTEEQTLRQTAKFHHQNGDCQFTMGTILNGVS
jgi:hypothetical protein